MAPELGEPGPAPAQVTTSFRPAWTWGARVGFVTGGFATLADCISVLSAAYDRSAPLLVLGIASVVVPTLTLLGGLGGLWIEGMSRAVSKLGSPHTPWLWGFTAALPLILGAYWVPWSWLSSHWPSLSSRHKAMAVALYFAMLAGLALLGRLAFHARERYRADRRPWFHWPLVGAALLVMLSAYWVDRTYYTDDYEDFHYGAAGAFVLGTALLTVLLEKTWPGAAAPRAVPPVTVSALWGAALLALFALPAFEMVGVKHAKALVLRKATQTLQAWSDLDGDGYSTILGSADCAPFDGSRSPGKVDVPGNGIDEDCSGSDATRWPERANADGYEVPDAHGFNLLLITIDTLRADHLGVYGYGRRTSPNIDRLATESVWFAHAYSQSTKTYESLPSLFTGLYPANVPRDHEHPRTVGKKPYLYTMTDEAVVLTQLLRRIGYHTYAVQNLWVLHTLGLDRGFADYGSADDITAPVLDSVATPFFLWLHYFEPHDPYVLHPEFNFGTRAIDRYDSEIAKVDSLIGRVLDRLRDRGLAERTVVVLTSDHGEEFGEHGGTSHTFKLHRESLHVPLIVKVPGVPPARIDEIVELVDVLPSLCESMRLATSCTNFDGQSLWAARAGRRDSGFGFAGAFAETDLRNGKFFRQSILTPEFRFNLNIDRHDVELFDVRADPQELRNIAADRPDVVRQLWDEVGLRPFRSLGPAFRSAEQGDIDELVAMLPRIRNETLLAFALDTIARHATPIAARALDELRSRPGLSPGVHQRLDDLLSGPLGNQSRE